MPRPPRADAPGVVHHVMIRGVDGHTIFRCVLDYEDFLARFGSLVRELGFVVLAWCLLGNHAHFVLQTGRTPLAVLMARLNSRHAQRFNRHNGRSGHLFQSRYKAVLVESESQLRSTIPYVLGNAARHGLTGSAGWLDYPWSMLAALAGCRAPREFEDARVVANALGFTGGRLREIVAATALEPASIGSRLEPSQLDELDLLIRECCRRHGVARGALRSRRPDVRAARIEVCSRAIEALDLSLAEIARHSGIPYDTVRRFAGKRS